MVEEYHGQEKILYPNHKPEKGFMINLSIDAIFDELAERFKQRALDFTNQQKTHQSGDDFDAKGLVALAAIKSYQDRRCTKAVQWAEEILSEDKITAILLSEWENDPSSIHQWLENGVMLQADNDFKCPNAAELILRKARRLYMAEVHSISIRENTCYALR